MEEQELNQLHPTATLEIGNGLTLVPRIKLNLTVYPSTPSTLTNPIDEWKMKRALIDFLQSSHSLSLPEEDLEIKRLKDLKKRKREDPVAAGTLRIWDLSFLQNDNDLSQWRNRLAEKMNGIELNLQGVRFTLAVSVPASDDFDAMKKSWEEFFAFQNRSSRREPDTIVLRAVPSRWFAEPRVSSKPSMLVTHTIFSKFGKIRNLNVAEDDDSGKDVNEDNGDLVSGLYCKIVVQFEKYRDFNDALRVLCGRSLQKQGSRLKADYEVSWDKDGFFRNSRNQTQEKNNMVSTMAADYNRSEAPRRQAYNSRYSPDKVRPRRFKVRF
ncbi:putative A-kinase anchor protein 17B [Sesbania bispinosa]|nr:putative A-kinase anchor protein 17B [Sesbania bispinosa]